MARKPTKEGAGKPAPKPKAELVFKFRDGSTTTLSGAEVARQLLERAIAMKQSDSPELEIAGKRLLKQIADGAGHALTAELQLQQRRAKGGRVGARKRSAKARADWQDKTLERARKWLLIRGNEPHNCASAMAPRAGKSAGTVRRFLKKEGVI